MAERSVRAYLCPVCRIPVQTGDGGYDCPDCARHFPILCGIPDFRLAPDRYLSLADERAKAERLYAFGQTHSFEELVAEYYRITDDVPPDMARKFANYIHTGILRGQEVLPKLAPADGGALVDIGCGAGGFVAAAAAAGHPVCGLDIALRWLVIAHKRLAEAGLQAELVCADIAASPLPEGSFAGAAALDLIEHLENGDSAMRAMHRLLSPGGRLIVTAANRYTAASYPLAGLWGIGFLPAGLRRRYIIARRGLDTLRNATLVSPGSVSRLLVASGFGDIRIFPLELAAGRTLQGFARLVRPVYGSLRTRTGFRQIMVATGPAFEAHARKPDSKSEDVTA